MYGISVAPAGAPNLQFCEAKKAICHKFLKKEDICRYMHPVVSSRHSASLSNTYSLQLPSTKLFQVTSSRLNMTQAQAQQELSALDQSSPRSVICNPISSSRDPTMPLYNALPQHRIQLRPRKIVESSASEPCNTDPKSSNTTADKAVSYSGVEQIERAEKDYRPFPENIFLPRL